MNNSAQVIDFTSICSQFLIKSELLLCKKSVSCSDELMLLQGKGREGNSFPDNECALSVPPLIPRISMCVELMSLPILAQ